MIIVCELIEAFSTKKHASEYCVTPTWRTIVVLVSFIKHLLSVTTITVLQSAKALWEKMKCLPCLSMIRVGIQARSAIWKAYMSRWDYQYSAWCKFRKHLYTGRGQGYHEKAERVRSFDCTVVPSSRVSFLLEVSWHLQLALNVINGAHAFRSGTPLINRAMQCWFVAVEPIKDELIANNKQTRW